VKAVILEHRCKVISLIVAIMLNGTGFSSCQFDTAKVYCKYRMTHFTGYSFFFFFTGATTLCGSWPSPRSHTFSRGGIVSLMPNPQPGAALTVALSWKEDSRVPKTRGPRLVSTAVSYYC
jgi:hypothetical protein